MSNILEELLSLLGDVIYLKGNYDVIKNNKKILSDFHDENEEESDNETKNFKWEDLSEDSENK